MAVIPGGGSTLQSRFALSPDGSRLVRGSDDVLGRVPGGSESAHDPRLLLSPTGAFDSIPVEGTEAASDPFFSPDGTSLGFTDRRTLKLVVMHLPNGTPKPIATLDASSPAVWTSDGSIFAARVVIDGTVRPGISRVFVDGRPPVTITTLGPGESRHSCPCPLPGERRLLFAIQDPRSYSIAVADLASRTHRILMAGTSPVWVATGHLVFYDSQQYRLMAVRFDPETCETIGQPSALVEGVSSLAIDSHGSFAVAGDGTLVYTPLDRTQFEPGEVQWVETGKAGVKVLPEDDWATPSLSPDGRMLVVRKIGKLDCTLWVFDFDRGTLARLTSEGDAHDPVWHPDGRHVVFNLDRHHGPREAFMAPIDGSAPPSLFHPNVIRDGIVTSISSKADAIAFSRRSETTGADVWTTPLSGDADARPFAASPHADFGGRFSPDGKWIAYCSDESGERQIYVRAFPGGGARHPVSTNGGFMATWSHDGRTLYYANGSAIYAVEVDASQGFSAGKPRVLVEDKHMLLGFDYDVSLDGRRVLVRATSRTTSAAHDLRAVYHWTRTLDRGR